VPLLESIQLPLSVPALVGSGAPAVPEISVDPLLPEHREERGEERGGEAGVEQRLNGDDLGRRAGPGGCVLVRVGEEGIVHIVDEDPHVGGGRVIWIWF